MRQTLFRCYWRYLKANSLLTFFCSKVKSQVIRVLFNPTESKRPPKFAAKVEKKVASYYLISLRNQETFSYGSVSSQETLKYSKLFHEANRIAKNL